MPLIVRARRVRIKHLTSELNMQVSRKSDEMVKKKGKEVVLTQLIAAPDQPIMQQ